MFALVVWTGYTKEDLDLFAFELTAAEMSTIDALK